MTTPVEVWAPAFARVLPEKLTATAVFSSAGGRDGRRWCNLCETLVRQAEQVEHVRQHQRERDQWRRRTRRERERRSEKTLREVNRLKREAAEVLGTERRGTANAAGRPSAVGHSRPAGRKEKGMASTTETKPKGDGASLFKALLARVREAKIGEVVEHKDGQYARVLIEDGKRNAGYVVPGKTKLNVYPQALAKQMPEGVGFKKVKLGAHHYGRGEVIVPVDREDDFDTALKALQAAAKLPAPQRKGAKKDEAASNGNGQPKAKASGPAKAGGQKASGPKARAAAKAPAGK